MIDELKRTWKAVTMAQSRSYPKYLPGVTDENYGKGQLEYLVSQLRFELITSEIQV
jgi:hypothetical protein